MNHRLFCLARSSRHVALAAGGFLLAALDPGAAAGMKFFSDDPIARAPETADASAAQPWDIDLFYDLSYNTFVTADRRPAGIRAQNLNTIDEVPDSSWFTNRIGARPVTAEEVQRGPVRAGAGFVAGR